MQSFRPCTYVCNTFEHFGGNMLECFNIVVLIPLKSIISKEFDPMLMEQIYATYLGGLGGLGGVMFGRLRKYDKSR